MNAKADLHNSDLKDIPHRELKSVRTRYPAIKEITPELIEALRSGDHTAYGNLYLGYVDSLTMFLRMLLGSKEEAEEIAHDVFLNIWENRESINSHLNIKGYIYKYAKNLALDQLRRRKVKDRYAERVYYSTEGFDLSPDETVIGKETELIIRIAIENMPKRQREVFEMSRYEGLSNKEIAAKLGISESTVRLHIHNTVKHLRELVALFIYLFLS